MIIKSACAWRCGNDPSPAWQGVAGRGPNDDGLWLERQLPRPVCGLKKLDRSMKIFRSDDIL